MRGREQRDRRIDGEAAAEPSSRSCLQNSFPMSTPGQMSLFLSSAPLVRLGEDSLPNGVASACLVDYRGKRFLLTVSHATGDQWNWALQLRYVPQKGTQLRQLGAIYFLAKATLSSPKLKDVDFSYVELPQGPVAYRQEVEVPTKEGPKLRFRSTR